MHTDQSEHQRALSDDAVLAYLMQNPEFFVNNQEVLPRLQIPHDSGAAVSLIEKQVSVLRGRCGHLENSLRDFIAVARENENLNRRLHDLIQDVISCSSLSSIITLMQCRLKDDFHADDVHLMLIASPTRQSRSRAAKDDLSATISTASVSESESDDKAMLQNTPGLRIVKSSDRSIRVFKTLFRDRSTVCGKPDKRQLRCLLGEDHCAVESAAVIPLHYRRRLGVLMLSSHDPSRFAESKGVMFLNQLGELLSRRIHSYGPVDQVLNR